MGNKPTHIAYNVREFEKNGKKDSFWTQIGVAFLHKDGKGLDVTLDALPVNGRVVLRIPEKKPNAAGNAEG